jgi:phosphatidylinositol glycan class Z
MSKLLLLFFLRLFAAIAGVGYIHPDAFFQSSEVAAKFVFGYEVVTPWEFHTHSIRSFISMFALSGFPYLILRAFDRLFRFLNITTRSCLF